MSVTIHAGGDEELQVSNANFSKLWRALGIGTNNEDFDFAGEIETEVLREQVAAFDMQLVVRKSFGLRDGWGGITNDQAAYYSEALKDVILDADLLGTFTIHWA